MTPHDLMQLALEQARLARHHDEVPIGAVLYHVPTDRILGQAHNRRILNRDPTAHAEVLAIRQAAQALEDWRLEETVLVVTLEPCPMPRPRDRERPDPATGLRLSGPPRGARSTRSTACAPTRDSTTG